MGSSGQLMNRSIASTISLPLSILSSFLDQARLEQLLQIYPPEEVESKRWKKIANALGNRTAKQVAMLPPPPLVRC